ncbi:hypothetical protein AHF37_01256 [Paragonimus kellicotti]|nr:hypothetical protein AHF37_01256 [Paragonimus kellicotti]
MSRLITLFPSGIHCCCNNNVASIRPDDLPGRLKVAEIQDNVFFVESPNPKGKSQRERRSRHGFISYSLAQGSCLKDISPRGRERNLMGDEARFCLNDGIYKASLTFYGRVFQWEQTATEESGRPCRRPPWAFGFEARCASFAFYRLRHTRRLSVPRERTISFVLTPARSAFATLIH